jgi:carbon-monoxide dehydrogenase medium subunit
MQPRFDVLRPRTVEEAIELLERYAGDARPIAGGTALTILLRQRLVAPRALISIERLPGLDGIVEEGDSIRIGALVTHRQVELSPLVRTRIPVLATTFAKVANVRVRNVATVGGVLAEADYASDPPPVFLALDAEVEAHGPSGRRVIPIRDFFVGFYETALEPSEVITSVRIPLPGPDTHAVYHKFQTRSSEDRPCLGVVASLRLASNGRTCEDLRVAVGAATEIPLRLTDVEGSVRGRDVTDSMLREVADRYVQAADTLDDMRGSAWYRREMIRVWVRRAVEDVRAEGTSGRHAHTV